MKKFTVVLFIILSGCMAQKISKEDPCAGVTSYAVDLQGNQKEFKCHLLWNNPTE